VGAVPIVDTASSIPATGGSTTGSADYGRLVRVKASHDPDAFFRFPQSFRVVAVAVGQLGPASSARG
jgi:hypothetical protein